MCLAIARPMPGLCQILARNKIHIPECIDFENVISSPDVMARVCTKNYEKVQ